MSCNDIILIIISITNVKKDLIYIAVPFNVNITVALAWKGLQTEVHSLSEIWCYKPHYHLPEKRFTQRP